MGTSRGLSVLVSWSDETLTTQIPDPSRANLTSAGGLNTRSTLLAIAGPSGAPLLVNPAPGQLGTMALGSVIGPGANQLDLSLTKRFTQHD